jgi:carbon-monoxide dehydrogenase small subunit
MAVLKKITVNGKNIHVSAEPEMRLIDVIRHKLKLTGTKEGCGEGECGACTVILNGDAVDSCLILLGQLEDGDKILTVEGLAKGDKLSVIQQSFIDQGAVQCGMCIPGMVVSAHALLARNKKPSHREIEKALAGNLCRCTGYKKIVDAVEKAAKKIRIAGGVARFKKCARKSKAKKKK